MADTLEDVLKRILVATKQNPNITAISDIDDTRYLVDRINEARAELHAMAPTFTDTNGTITITPSARLFDLPAGLDPYTIYPWSWRINGVTGDIPVQVVTLEYTVRYFDDYETMEGPLPKYLYFEDGKIGIYPLLEAGSSNLTLQYVYPATMVRLTSLADTFDGWPDEWTRYVELVAQARYEVLKGFGVPDLTYKDATTIKDRIRAKIMKTKRSGFKGYRAIGGYR